MWCCKCQHDLSECTCPDLMERLNRAAQGNFAYKRCTICQKHYAQCRCTNPEWEIVGAKARAPSRRDEGVSRES